MSSKPNHARRTPDFSYPLLCSTSFSSSSPSLAFLSTPLPSSLNTKWSHPSLSLHAMIMSWHQVQHSPSTAVTKVQSPRKILCLPFIPIMMSWPMNVASASSVPPYTIDRHPPSSPWQLKVEVTLSHSHRYELNTWRIESQHLASHPSTRSKCLSKLAGSQHRSGSPKLLDHGLQVHLQTHSITTAQCITQFTRSWPPILSPNQLDYHLQVHLQPRSITAPKCISQLAQLWPSGALPYSLNDGLQVHLQTRLITTSECISELTPRSFSGAPHIALKHSL